MEVTGAHLIVGSLEVDGDLTNGGILAVTGDVVVRGLYEEGTGFAQLLVGGSFEVEHVLTDGAIQVAKDFRASGLVLATGNDHEIVVGGELSAGLLVEDDKSIRFGALRCTRRRRGSDALDAVLVPGVLAAGGALDVAALRSHLRARTAIMREAVDGDSRAAALTPRLAALLETAARAASWRFEDAAGGRACLVLQLVDGARQRSFVSAEERGLLEAALAR